jgi:hypothetical protein
MFFCNYMRVLFLITSTDTSHIIDTRKPSQKIAGFLLIQHSAWSMAFLSFQLNGKSRDKRAIRPLWGGLLKNL